MLCRWAARLPAHLPQVPFMFSAKQLDVKGSSDNMAGR